ncbi:hypothetical protein [Deinococcus kurensis]|uniref:hypothetical protein n=1 Tax=Deinococcus kurensis TaxID=2662757 RepID=UPI0012D315F5|nr:hypothetical protein [Deinococcus kurensis]
MTVALAGEGGTLVFSGFDPGVWDGQWHMRLGYEGRVGLNRRASGAGLLSAALSARVQRVRGAALQVTVGGTLRAAPRRVRGVSLHAGVGAALHVHRDGAVLPVALALVASAALHAAVTRRTPAPAASWGSWGHLTLAVQVHGYLPPTPARVARVPLDRRRRVTPAEDRGAPVAWQVRAAQAARDARRAGTPWQGRTVTLGREVRLDVPRRDAVPSTPVDARAARSAPERSAATAAAAPALDVQVQTRRKGVNSE